MYRKWVNDGIHKPGKKASELAKALGVHRGTIYKIIAGTREIHINELPIISRYIEEPIPMAAAIVESELLTLHIERKVGVGCWYESGVPQNGDLGNIVTPRDANNPNAVHHAYAFSGDSMVDAGILDGDILIGVEPNNVSSGKIVVVERDRSGVIEFSARIVTVLKDRVEYATASPNESYKPIVVANKGKHTEHVKVVAVVKRIVRSVP